MENRLNMKDQQRWNLGHSVLLFGGIQVALFGLGYFVKFIRGQRGPLFGEAIVGNEENNDYYNQFKQPVFAPPDWVFAPVWSVNNALVVWGITRVMNKPEGSPGRERFLALQAASLLEFSAFNAAYFGLNSPINGAVLTVTDLFAIIECMRIALYQMKDWKVVLSLSTLLPWLVLASFTSTAVALWNRDGFYRTEPLVTPPQFLVKSTEAKGE